MGGKMKKNIILCAMLFLGGRILNAEAPVLRNICPQNYGRVFELSQSEGESLLAETESMLDAQLKKDSVGNDFSFKAVFRQNEGIRHFYRIFYSRKKLEHLQAETIPEGTFDDDDLYWAKNGFNSIYQIIMEKSATGFSVLDGGWISKWEENNNGVRLLFTDFLLVPVGERIGFLKTEVHVPLALGQTSDGLIRMALKHRGGKAYGNQSAKYQLIAAGDKNLFGKSTSYLEMTASDCLVETGSPLKYSLLSGFDKNAATCCKENSSDNMMSIQADFHMTGDYIRRNGKLKLLQAALINGDASSKTNYFGTDRIETLTVEAWDPSDSEVKKETFSFTLNDYCLGSQTVYLPFEPGKYSFIFNTSAVIRAKKEDVCFSEFNIKLGKEGWIFGSLL